MKDQIEFENKRKALFDLVNHYANEKTQLMVPAFQLQCAIEAMNIMKQEIEALKTELKNSDQSV